MSQFHELIEFIRTEVNKGLKRMSIPDEPGYLYDPIRYTLKGKGKRFRPILVHLAGRTNNVDPDALMNMVADAWEDLGFLQTERVPADRLEKVLGYAPRGSPARLELQPQKSSSPWTCARRCSAWRRERRCMCPPLHQSPVCGFGGHF